MLNKLFDYLNITSAVMLIYLCIFVIVIFSS